MTAERFRLDSRSFISYFGIGFHFSLHNEKLWMVFSYNAASLCLWDTEKLDMHEYNAKDLKKVKGGEVCYLIR